MIYDFLSFCDLGDLEVVKLLIKIVDPSIDNNSAIGFASFAGNTEIVKILLEDPRVDPTDNYHFSILNADNKVILKLLIHYYICNNINLPIRYKIKRKYL